MYKLWMKSYGTNLMDKMKDFFKGNITSLILSGSLKNFQFDG